MSTMKIALASVVKGFRLRNVLRDHLASTDGVEVMDLGVHSMDRFVKYTEYARRGAEAVRSGRADRAILVCGTGMGMAIAANKIRGIHAACCESVAAARMSRIVNDANVLTLGGDIVEPGLAREIVDVWINTEFQDAPGVSPEIRDFWREAVEQIGRLGSDAAGDGVTRPTAARAAEITSLMELSPEEVRGRAGERLVVCESLEALHQALAEEMAREIEANNAAGRPTRLILPVGPTGQYPFLVELVRRRRISLRRCHLFFMDEYCGSAGRALPGEHPLSFQGTARRLLLARLDPALAPPPAQVVFPGERNVEALGDLIDSLGGIDTCYGGVGIHGHLAFNEPTPGVAGTGPRRVELNDYTVTINAVRAEVGGNLEGFPRAAYTLGMRQILGARRVVLACRNGTTFDWANTVLRLALFGRPGDDYPVTHIRGREYLVLTDRDTLASPRHVLGGDAERCCLKEAELCSR